jgi:hypothetical protein
MATMPRHLRGLLIAFAAIFATSAAAGEVSACSMKEWGNAGCATVCGCCSSATTEAPTPAAQVEGRATRLRAPVAIETAPGGGCTCRSQEPAVPAPRPAPSPSGSRTQPGHAEHLAQPGPDHVAPIAISSQLPLTQSPPKIPLYLRNERLLF